MSIILFFIFKFCLYYFWAYRGLQNLKQEVQNARQIALLVGSFRVVLGLFLGFITGLIGLQIFSYFQLDFTNLKRAIGMMSYFLFLFLPAQALAWFATYKLLLFKAKAPVQAELQRRWIIGGMFISTVCDLPFIILSGLVIGVC